MSPCLGGVLCLPAAASLWGGRKKTGNGSFPVFHVDLTHRRNCLLTVPVGGRDGHFCVILLWVLLSTTRPSSQLGTGPLTKQKSELGRWGPSYETSDSQEAPVTFTGEIHTLPPLHPSTPLYPRTPSLLTSPCTFWGGKKASHVSAAGRVGSALSAVEAQGGQLTPPLTPPLTPDRWAGLDQETGLRCRLGVTGSVLPFRGTQRGLVLTLGVSLECHELTASLLSVKGSTHHFLDK